mgnify:FL=1
MFFYIFSHNISCKDGLLVCLWPIFQLEAISVGVDPSSRLNLKLLTNLWHAAVFFLVYTIEDYPCHCQNMIVSEKRAVEIISPQQNRN